MGEQHGATRRKRSWLVTIAAAIAPAVVFLALPTTQAAAAGRFSALEDATRAGMLDRAVAARLQNDGHVEALVGFSYAPAAGRMGFAAQKTNLLASTGHGAAVLRSYETLPVALVRFDSEEALLAAMNDPEVLTIQANGRSAPEVGGSLPQVGQPIAERTGFVGTGGTIAVLDTGVDYTRPEFGSCAAPNKGCTVVVATDIAPDDRKADDYGHGTWTAAIAAATAPGARIAALDVFNGGWVYDADVVAALDWVVRNAAKYNITSVNMSLAHYREYHTGDCRKSVLSGPIAAVRAAGILPIAAAGNQGTYEGTFTNGVSWPACVPGVVSVGAVYNTSGGPFSFSGGWVECSDASIALDQPTCFSQSARSLDVWAPGAFVSAGGWDGGYGTSASAPFVAGAAAVLAAASPGATVDQVEAAITGSGPIVTDTRPEPDVRARRLDLPAALDGVLQAETSTTITGALSGYKLTSGKYAVYGPKAAVRFTGRLMPSQGGESVTVAWEKLISGVWTKDQAREVLVGADGSASIRIASGLAVGARYRLRAEYAGDADHAGSVSKWLYFMLSA